MTIDSPSGDAPSAYQPPTLRGLIRGHRRISALVVAVLVLVVGLAVTLTVVGSHQRPAALTDASTCTQWSAAVPAQQSAYAQLYITEHGGAGFLSATALRSTIHQDCVRAAYLGESDDLSLVGAIDHAF